MACQAVCLQLCLPTLAFKATDFRQMLEDAIALPDFLLAAAAAAAPDGHLRRDIVNALDARGSTASTPSDLLDLLDSDI
eukprot:311829-Chlamydomonas_euryale.AAC.4